MLLSLDLSTKSSGYAIFDEGILIKYGCITSASTDTIKRIYIMRDAINQLLIDTITLFDDYDLEVLEISLIDNFVVYQDKEGILYEIPYDNCEDIIKLKEN